MTTQFFDGGDSMKIIVGILFASIIFCGVLSPQGSIAEQKKELPRSGSLASTMTSGQEDVAVSQPWGDDDISGKNPPPISGSISRLNQRKWLMKVFNNTKDRYSVDVEVVQFNEKGTRLRSDYFSYTLDGNQSVEREVSSALKVTECQVNLRDWRKYEKKKEGEAPEEEKAADQE